MPKEIEVNSVAYVKITFEPVFILKIEGEIVTVRRGVMAQAGSYYTMTQFTLPELQAEDPRSGNGFDQLFKTEDGEITIASASSPDGSFQN